jgi:hypothetical protein
VKQFLAGFGYALVGDYTLSFATNVLLAARPGDRRHVGSGTIHC